MDCLKCENFGHKCHKCYHVEYYKKNKDNLKCYRKNYYKENTEKERCRSGKYYKENTAKQKEYAKKHYEANKEKKKEQYYIRRFLKGHTIPKEFVFKHLQNPLEIISVPN
jgi:hypothetical protein